METIRSYRGTDHEQWLRCRVLSFLHTPYFDDVLTRRPAHPGRSLELVAVDGDAVTGLVDVTWEGAEAVIETIAVHPDHQGRGLGTRLLEAVLPPLRREGVAFLDAWTRDQQTALDWYRGRGFTESDHYLHVYAEDAEAHRAVAPRDGVRAVRTFLHADLAREREARAAFGRVHVCRRFRLALASGSLPSPKVGETPVSSASG